ncbi:hypothetical protein CVP04_04770 [Caviibacterium pharyngocola]|uniref:Integrase catalytic domain-containing protein n=1 Tax=Caviibacterium pharyngocola TaxID=28159 RepID=A0A2M8RX35_9PAST|nr:hypothetical protein CVP04_04770 [Caviibacterium pharyngocola]
MKDKHKLPLLLQILCLSRSTYYYKTTAKDKTVIRQQIRRIYEANDRRDGYRILRVKLRERGIFLSSKTVLSHMQALGIQSSVKAKRRRKWGKTSHIAPNLLERDFTANKLKQKLVTDVTEFRVGNEKLYLSPMMDLANREIIAYEIGKRPSFALVSKMLKKTLKQLKPDDLPIIHSAQGVLYGLTRWRELLIREDGSPYAMQSMSRRGNCYDNAVIESFFSVLKSECFYTKQFANIAELEQTLHNYIRYYNEERIKLSLKNLSPANYRAQYLS